MIDLVETPIRFATPSLSRTQKVIVGRRVFAATNRLEVLLGAALLPLTLGKRPQRWQIMLCLLGALAFVQCVSLQPRMRRVAMDLDFEDGDRTDGQHRRLHRLYVGLDAIKLLLGMGFVAGDEERARTGADQATRRR